MNISMIILLINDKTTNIYIYIYIYIYISPRQGHAAAVIYADFGTVEEGAV